MKIQNTPAPYPSTIISLEPQESFRYRNHTIQSVTISPLPQDAAAPYTLSGTSGRAYTLPDLPLVAGDLLRAQAAQELARYAQPLHPAAPARSGSGSGSGSTQHKGRHRA